MKKTATILLGSLCALCAQAADNIIGGTNYLNRTPIKGEDVILNPITGSTAEAFFGSNDPTYTIRSLSTTGTTSKWNCAFGLVIDINSTAETFDAFYNNGLMQWNDPYGKNLVFKNSAGNSTYANIDWGTFYMQVNTSSQSNKLQILTNANITGKSFTTSVGNIQMLVDNNSTVNYQMSGTTTFNNNSSLKIASGSTFNATNSSFAFNSNSSAIINGVFNYVNTNSVNLKLRNATISGAGAKVIATEVKSGTANANSQIYFDGENIVSDGASIEATGALRLNGGSRLVIDDTAGEIKLTKTVAGGILYWGRVLFAGNGELIVNKKDAFTTDNTKGFAQLTNVGGLTNPNKLTVAADNNFEGVYFQDSSRMEITVIDGVKANFNTVGRNASNDATDAPIFAELHFTDFVDDTIFFNEKGWWNDEKLILTASDGSNTYTKDQLALVEVNSAFGKYALRFQIPEPSTYAAVFGAIALGLAAYRRRR